MSARRQPSSSGSLSVYSELVPKDTDQMSARKQLPPPGPSPAKPKFGAGAGPQDIAQAGPTVLDAIEDIAHARSTVHNAFKEGPLVVNDADPSAVAIEPTWSPACNSAHRFKDGAKGVGLTLQGNTRA